MKNSSYFHLLSHKKILTDFMLKNTGNAGILRIKSFFMGKV
jgi:hypothetical protein